MRIWLAGAALVGIPIFVGTLVDVTTGSHHMIGDTWVGLIVPPALALFGTVLPKVGRLLGEERPEVCPGTPTEHAGCAH
jgi:hypothetical protein